MQDDQDYIRELTEMRTMMERTSKFLSLSGLAGIMAGLYALAGAFIAYRFFSFNPDQISDHVVRSEGLGHDLKKVIFLATIILVLAIGTAIFHLF